MGALCAYAFLNVGLVMHVPVVWHASAFEGAGYVLLCAVAALSLTVLLMSLHRYLLPLAVLLLAVVVTTNHLALELLDLRVVNQYSAEWLLWEMAEVPAFVQAFTGPLVRQFALTMGLLLPLVCVARFARRRFLGQRRAEILGLCAALVYAANAFTFQHEFGAYVPIESNLVVYGAKLLVKTGPDIPPVDLQPVEHSPVDNIILLVDESVTYDAYVSHVRARWARWDGIDFGEAASLGTCSASSNSMLRWGFRASHMLAGEDPRLAPTIWSYARAAGYETILIDGQRNGSYQNYMGRKEAQLIGRTLRVSEAFDTDRAIARLLRQLTTQPGRHFIYINKRGSHFPYTNAYPPDLLPGARTRQEEYARAVTYTTADFLDLALPGVPLERTLILYTSDHGEQFGEGSPHCNAAPSWEESSVPLVLLTRYEPLAAQARAAASTLKDRASHEQVFATLLHAMGYDVHVAEAEYGSSLYSPHVPPHYYHVSSNPLPTKAGRASVIEFNQFPYRESHSAAASAQTASTSVATQ